MKTACTDGGVSRVRFGILGHVLVCLTAASSVRATTLTFDGDVAGTIIVDQYPGVTFPGGPTIVDVTKRSPRMATVSGSQALGTSDSSPLVAQFASPCSHVRVFVGAAAASLTQPVVVELAAYRRSSPTKAEPLAAASVRFIARSDIVVPLDVFQALGQDINEVRITAQGALTVLIDNLVFENVAVANRTIYNFDSLSPGTHLTLLPGVGFPQSPEVVNEAVLRTTTASSPNALIKDLATESDAGPLLMDFTPAQGAVRFRIGNPPPFGLPSNRFTIRAFANRGGSFVEVAQRNHSFAANAAVQVPIEIDRWTEQDIARIEVQGSDISWETVDNIEFGPFPPVGGADSTPPQVAITAPATNLTVWRTSEAATRINYTIQGRITENQVPLWVEIYAQLAGAPAVATNRLTGGLVRIDATTWTFSSTVELRQGVNRVWALASDLAGNRSRPTPAVQITYGPPDSAITSYSPRSITRSYVLREDDPATAWNDRYTIPASSNRMVLTGRNLHDRIGVYFHHPAGYNADAAVIERSPRMDRLVVEIPAAVQNDTTEATWSIYATDGLWFGQYRELMGNSGWFTVFGLPFPRVHGNGYRNEGDQPTWGEFFGVFGANAYTGWPWYARDRVYRRYYDWVYEPAMRGSAAGSGTCFGIAGCAQAMRNGFLDTRLPRTDGVEATPNMRYPAGFTSSGKPARYHFPPDAPGYWLNYWGKVRSCHGIQLSAGCASELIAQLRVGALTSGSVAGDPVACLERIRANPAGYVVSMIRVGGASGLAGHAVVPYRVDGNRIYVFDSNRPYYNNQPESSQANRDALASYIEVDRYSNTYRFHNLGWCGRGLFVFPVSLFNRVHVMIADGLSPLWTAVDAVGTVVEFFAGLFGSGDVGYETPDGQGAWGWTAGGTFQDNLPGAMAIVPMNDGEATRAVFMASVSNYPTLNLRANVRQNGAYNFAALRRGVMQRLNVLNPTAGDSEALTLFKSGDGSSGFGYTPARAGTRVVAGISLADPNAAGRRTTLFEWSRLTLPATGSVRFYGEPAEQRGHLVNLTGVALTPTLLVSHQNGSNSVGEALYPDVLVPDGADARLTVPNWPDSSNLLVEIDGNRDGTFEQNAWIPGRSVAPADNPGEPDANSNGIIDSVDMLFASSRDANRNGIPDDGETGELYLQRYSQSLARNGGSSGVAVYAPAGHSWTVVNTSAWLRVTSPTSGTGNGAVAFEADGHNGLARSTDLVVAGMILTVTQDGVAPTLTLTPTERTIPLNGGSTAFTVSAPDGLSWTVVNSASWITITGSTGGSGNGVVRFSVEGHVGPARSAFLTVNGETFTVNQEGVTPPTFAIEPATQPIPFNGGWFVISVTAPAGTAWSVANPYGTWITLLEGATGTGTGRVVVAVNGHSGPPRSATLFVNDLPCAIEQAGDPSRTVFLTPETFDIPWNGGSFVCSVSTATNQPWTPVVTQGWLTILDGRDGGTGPGSFVVAVDGREGPARVGTVQVGDATLTINQPASPVTELTLATTSVRIPANGASFFVDVLAPAGLAWEVTDLPAWMHVLGGEPGPGTGWVSLGVDYNPDAPRSITIRIGGAPFLVEQDGEAVVPVTLVPSWIDMEAGGGLFFVDVTLPAGQSWDVANLPAFVHVVSGAPGMGSGFVEFSVDPNEGESRKLAFEIAGLSFSLLQNSGIRPAVLTPAATNVPAPGAVFFVDVAAAPAFSWTVENTCSWVTVRSGAPGAGNGIVELAVEANAGPPRLAQVLIGGEPFAINQEGVYPASVAVDPGHALVPATGGVINLNVEAPWDYLWTAVSTDSWLTVLNSDPSGFGKGAISVSVAPHGDAGRRVGAVSIGDTSCVVTQLSVLAADLAVSVQPEPVFALLNQPAVYAFTVTNAGPAKAAAARIQFVLPADVAFVRGVGPAGGWSQNGSVVTCLLGDVEATRAVRIAIELTCAIDRATECAVLVGWSGDDPVALNDAAAFVVRGLTPDGDADGDGMRNEDEIRAGTRPDDSVSVLRIVGVRKDGTGLLTVQFRSGSGKTFVVEGRSSLVSGAWEALGSAVNGDGTARDVSGRPTTQRYYLRVRLVP